MLTQVTSKFGITTNFFCFGLRQCMKLRRVRYALLLSTSRFTSTSNSNKIISYWPPFVISKPLVASQLFCKQHLPFQNITGGDKPPCTFSTSSNQNQGHMNCWNCGAQSHLHFCTECKVVQPPNMSLNYFDVLGIPLQFDLHLPTLTEKFRHLQAQLHPDLFTLKSEEEQVYSADQSALVNIAYQTLLKPLPRALYLLELFGHPIEEGTTDTVDAEFLMEIMEINEEIAQAESFQELQSIDEANQKALRDLSEQLEFAFRDADYPSANNIVCRLKYFANVDDRLRTLEMQSEGY